MGGIAMETEYVSFQRGKVAAVRLTNTPPLFQNFAATITHETTGVNQSQTTYIYNFHAKPAGLAWLLEPIMNCMLRRETHARLAALKRYLESEGIEPPEEAFEGLAEATVVGLS